MCIFNRKNLRKRLSYSSVLIATAVLFSACSSRKSERDYEKVRNTSAYQPLNVYAYEQLPQGSKRAVMLPILYPHSSSKNIQDTLDTNFRAALNKANLFEVVTISKNDMLRLFSKQHISTTEQLPHDFFDKIVKEYAADLVLFTEITEYDPYTPIRIGVRSSLISTRSFGAVWSFDDVFNAGDPRVASGALTYEDANARAVYPQHISKSVLISPMEFSSYVAQTLYATLPGRQKRLPQLKKPDESPMSKQRMPIPSPVAINSELSEPAPEVTEKQQATSSFVKPPAEPVESFATEESYDDSATVGSYPPPRPRPVFSN